MRLLRALAAMSAALVLIIAAPATAAEPAHRFGWRTVHTDGVTSLRGLSAVGPRTAWAGGTDGHTGVVLRTVDGGRSWRAVTPPNAAGLDFRDVEAFDADHAVALSAGNGTASALFVTADGGRHWTKAYQNTDPAAFLDCAAFYDRRHGLAVSDPVGGRFRILSTDDGGGHWQVLPNGGMPPAQAGESAFAASGTCLVTVGHTAYLASGGGAVARVYRSDDGGRHWRATDTRVPSSASAGIFSLAFRDPRHGVAVGGDYAKPATAPDALAVTSDGGRSWPVQGGRVPGQYRSGAAFADGHTVLAVGTTGSDVSSDGGRTWSRFDAGNLNAVACGHGACWADGPKGTIAVLD